MAKVLKADNSALDSSYVQKNFAATHDDAWVTLQIGFAQAALDLWTTDPTGATSYSGNFIELLTDTGGGNSTSEIVYIDGAAPGKEWVLSSPRGGGAGTSATPIPAAGSYITVEVHYTKNVQTKVYVGGTLVISSTALNEALGAIIVGQDAEAPVGAAAVAYVAAVKVGTTRGGSEVFADDFEDGTLAAWSSTTGDVSVVTNPLASHPGYETLDAPQGICVAFDDATLEPHPLWTRLDTKENVVASFDIKRGRSYELDKTDTGTATVTINDVDGDFDPTNVTSPFNGDLEPLKQAAIALWNPVDADWKTIFRGFVEDWSYVLHPSEKVMVLTLQLVDALAVLADIEVAPGTAGTLPPPESVGNVWYEDADVDDRIIEALADAGWPPTLTEIFSGNVHVQETVYAPRSTILQIIQDAADAEFPGVANVYVSKDGKVTFHGRLARFNPDNVSYNIHVFKAGDGAAIELDPDRAQIRELGFNRGKTTIINAALATPQKIRDTAIAGQLVTDSTSIAQFGVNSWSAENLLTQTGLLTGNLALAETKLFATYYVDNYAQPKNRVNQITFKTLRPTDARALHTWRLLTRVEISDIIDLESYHPGGGGFAEEFYVEGLTYTVRPLTPEYHDVTLTLDVSPKSFYDTNPFEVA